VSRRRRAAAAKALTLIEREAEARYPGDPVAQWKHVFRASAGELLRHADLSIAAGGHPPAERERRMAEVRAILDATLERTTRDLRAAVAGRVEH
jgi:hypothetical protein